MRGKLPNATRHHQRAVLQVCGGNIVIAAIVAS